MPQYLGSVRPIFTFEDEALFSYEKPAAKRLQDIIERLELGENANLQLAQETWTPDDNVRVSYKVMEGILEPIIIVDVSYQQPRVVLEREEGEEIPEIEEESRYYYIPYAWIGIASNNHALTGDSADNPNCGFYGYPPEGRLIGFEPGLASGFNFKGEEYGYQNTVESLPGLTYASGFLPTWISSHEGQAGYDYNRIVTVILDDDLGYERDDELIDEGFFGDQDWHLTVEGRGLVVSEGGMHATENLTCYESVPEPALRPVVNEEADAGIEPQDLEPTYWQRSIIISGGQVYVTRNPEDDTEDGAVKTWRRPCIVTGERPTETSPSITLTQLISEDFIPGTVLPGEYEINAYSQSFECECIDARIHIRLVLGQINADIEYILNGFTYEADKRVKWEAIVDVIDIFPAGIGEATQQQRFLARDLVLGGLGPCDSVDDRGGLYSGGSGIWQRALFVNPVAATWRLGAPTFSKPFYDEPSCGPSSAEFTGPNHPDCKGCSSFSGQTNGFGIASDILPCLHFAGDGTQGLIDLREACAFHLARVVSVDPSKNNTICFVQLVGNDGGAGNCSTPPFSYGFLNAAIGVDPGIPLGSDYSQYPNQGEIGGWQVGELVCVVGYSQACDPACEGVDITADWQWVVTKVRTATDDFTQLFWSQFRCGSIVETFWRRIQDASRLKISCADGSSDPTTLQAQQFIGDFGAYTAFKSI